jgi:hypothetical protein
MGEKVPCICIVSILGHSQPHSSPTLESTFNKLSVLTEEAMRYEAKDVLEWTPCILLGSLSYFVGDLLLTPQSEEHP